MLGKKIGIDLGTANSVVFIQGEGIAFVEPTVVAIDINKAKVIAVGDDWQAVFAFGKSLPALLL